MPYCWWWWFLRRDKGREREIKKVKMGEEKRETGLIIWKDRGGQAKVLRKSKMAEVRRSLDLYRLQYPQCKYLVRSDFKLPAQHPEQRARKRSPQSASSIYVPHMLSY